jgi:hypothetical protein
LLQVGGVPYKSIAIYNSPIGAGRLALDYRHKEIDRMILKMLDYEKSKNGSYEKESWTYFDKITSARTYYDEEINETVVCCSFTDNDMVTFAVPYVAYLMSDDGKTIDRISAAEKDAVAAGNEGMTLQEAVQSALSNEC